MRKYKYLGLLLILLSFSELKSISPKPQDSLGNNLWYFEMSGNKGFYTSFNFEYLLLKDSFFSNNVSIRTGVGGLVIFIFTHFEFPLMINFIFGKKYSFEASVGVSFDYVPESYRYEYPSQVVKFRGTIGYRFISDEGLIFRTGIIPIYFAGSGINIFYGISFGHYF